MTDIREKVARAIANAYASQVAKDLGMSYKPATWDAWDAETKARHLEVADAAFSACRYQEMREAIRQAVQAEMDNPHGSQWPAWFVAARAALSDEGEP